MLGRFAHDLAKSRQGKPITTQSEAQEAMKKEGERLWDVMVEMTQPAQRVEPRQGADGDREKRLLDVKYRIFRESVDVQKRWRGMVAEALRLQV